MTTQARELVRASLDAPELIDQIDDDDDLAASGVNSGERVQLAAACERLLERPLMEEDLLGLTSIRALSRFLAAGLS
jgi:hypothetical protein